MKALHRWLQRVWYDGNKSGLILLPFSGLYWLINSLRSLLYDYEVLQTYAAPAPLIVVGNITVGGTGKTPTVLWLIDELRARGYTPGIVSRGYGGSRSGTSMRVDSDSDAAVVGDEPVLLARRGECPVAVDADRIRAAQMLVDDGVDVIIADDGLQHRRMQRDFEICVIDGARGLGNRRLLPAGPLRESPRRLDHIDLVLINGGERGTPAYRFELLAREASRLNGSKTRPLADFRDKTVHAVAGIGNPQRFFDLLRGHGIQVIEHSFPDHAPITKTDIAFADDFDVFMTEKDAVKLGQDLADKYWFVAVDFAMDADISNALIERIEQHLQPVETADA